MASMAKARIKTPVKYWVMHPTEKEMVECDIAESTHRKLRLYAYKHGIPIDQIGVEILNQRRDFNRPNLLRYMQENP